MENNNILYIPIQINGGTEIPNNLLDRELFIKDRKLYVGTGSGKVEEVIGRVADGVTIKDATLESPTMKNMKVDVYSSPEKITNSQKGAVYFIDEGNFPD